MLLSSASHTPWLWGPKGPDECRHGSQAFTQELPKVGSQSGQLEFLSMRAGALGTAGKRLRPSGC